MLNLKEQLAQLESYFHGTSSGMDPLNCYLKHPLLIHNKKDISMVGIPDINMTRRVLFFINTGKPGKTNALVNTFLERCRVDDYMSRIREEIIPLNDLCIKSLIKGETKSFSIHCSLFQPSFTKTLNL
jgi:mevalonate kinase